MKTLNILSKCIGISGLQGIDHLLSIKIMENLKEINRQLTIICDEPGAKNVLSKAYGELKQIGEFNRRYEAPLGMLKKTCKNVCEFLTD